MSENERYDKLWDKIISKSNIPARKSYYVLMGLCVIIHVFFSVLFAAYKVYPLFAFNAASTIMYGILFFNVSKGDYSPVIACTFIEIMVHVTVATILLGWHYGFYLQIVTIASLAFFCPFTKKNLPYFFSIASIAVFIFLRVYTYTTSPVYTIGDEYIKRLLYAVNAVATMFVLIYFSIILRNSVISSQHELEEINKELRKVSETDPLTGLLNRRSMLDALENANKRRLSHGEPFSVIIGDIDDFKHINDTFGHDAGDKVLSDLALLISSVVRPEDFTCRWGGEEILILLVNADSAYADETAEKIRARIDESSFIYDTVHVHVSMTLGVCSDSTDIREMILTADKRLYSGKQSGKNTVVSNS